MYSKHLIFNKKYNILTQVVGGRAFIRSELVGKDDAYEYIRRVYDYLDNRVTDCRNSEYEKQKVAVLHPEKVELLLL